MKRDSVLNLSLIIVLAYSFSAISFRVRRFNLEPINAQDAETRLSLGLSLNLNLVGIYELTLLDRIAERVAVELLRSRREIISDVTKNGVSLQMKLRSVKGIGPKGSKYLAENLELGLGE